VPICAAVAVIGGAFAATSASGIEGKCLLHPSMTLTSGSPGAGPVGYRLTIRNSGPGRCHIRRHPELTLVTATGEIIATNVDKTGPTGEVPIPVGGAVNAELRFGTYGDCGPRAVKIRIAFHNVHRRGPIDPPTPVCNGRIEMGALG
jgi:hypothetical protein